MARKNKRRNSRKLIVQEPIVRAEFFRPHNFTTKYVILDPPKPIIYIPKSVAEKMYHYVNLCEKEISWLGTVEESESDFIIEDVFLLHQDVSGTHTRLDPEVVAKFYQELLTTPEGTLIANKIKLWGHSHVNMDTNASGQDDTQMAEFSENGNDYFIRLICNKKTKMSFSVFFYKEGLIAHDVEWCVLNEFNWDEEVRIKKEIEDKVTTTNYSGYQNRGTWCGHCNKNHTTSFECRLKTKQCTSCKEWYDPNSPHSCDDNFPKCEHCHTNHHKNYNCIKKTLEINKLRNDRQFCDKCQIWHFDKTHVCSSMTTYCNICHTWYPKDTEHKCSDIIKSLTHRTVRRIQNESIPKTMIGSDKSTEVIHNAAGENPQEEVKNQITEQELKELHNDIDMYGNGWFGA